MSARARSVILLLPALLIFECRGPKPPPSFLLFVMDTMRADALSPYGAVEGSSPAFAALADQGVVYEHAYAHAPWTLPSHASLFTGLLPGRHGVGLIRTRLPDSFVTIGEHLHNAGYQTLGVSENIWVSEQFGTAQGFAEFVYVPRSGPDTLAAIEDWAKRRKGTTPFFVFVNVIDTHAPYAPHGPCAVPAPLPSRIQAPLRRVCSTASDIASLPALRALYQCEVRHADAKLGSVYEILSGLDRAGGPLITIATSDHGEHLGEHGLLSHQFSLRNALLQVPLLVHGLPDKAPVRVTTPVGLASIAPAIAAWAGVDSGWSAKGARLPLEDSAATAEPVVSVYADPDAMHSGDRIGLEMIEQTKALRESCDSDDRVLGGMRAVLQHPFKLIAYERYPAQLYDLASDPEERVDLASRQPERTAALSAVLDAHAVESFGTPTRGGAGPDDEQMIEALRALGYVADPE